MLRVPWGLTNVSLYTLSCQLWFSSVDTQSLSVLTPQGSRQMFLSILRIVLKAHLWEHRLRVSTLLPWNPTLTIEGIPTSVTPLAYLHIYFLFFFLLLLLFYLFFFFKKKMHKAQHESERSLENCLHFTGSPFLIKKKKNLWWTFPDRICQGVPGNFLCLPLVLLYQDTARREVGTELLRCACK